jgi:hypothetical protein
VTDLCCVDFCQRDPVLWCDHPTRAGNCNKPVCREHGQMGAKAPGDFATNALCPVHRETHRPTRIR